VGWLVDSGWSKPCLGDFVLVGPKTGKKHEISKNWISKN
jgi:hypothetical protein